MSDSLFGDTSFKITQLALDGLSQRQDAISNNIANIDTPNYSAQTVDFQSVLKQAISGQTQQLALEKTDPRQLASTTDSVTFARTDRPGGTERADGNNVDIDVELTDMSENEINYQAMTEAMSQKLQLLKDLAG
jgi:flagellar basal-body rod protein FlgB